MIMIMKFINYIYNYIYNKFYKYNDIIFNKKIINSIIIKNLKI